MGCTSSAIRLSAEGLLREIAPPRNEPERLIAQGLLLAIASQRIGIPHRDLLFATVGRSAQIVGESRVPCSHPEPSVARRAKALIDERFRDALTVSALSRSLHVHRNRLSRDFRSAFAMSIPGYTSRTWR